VIGGFLLASLPLRRVLSAGHWRVRLAHFPLIGVFFGLLSSTVVAIGAALTPFYLAYGSAGAPTSPPRPCAPSRCTSRGARSRRATAC
jgi:hypothetical protein